MSLVHEVADSNFGKSNRQSNFKNDLQHRVIKDKLTILT